MQVSVTVNRLAQTLFAGAGEMAKQLLDIHGLAHKEKVETLSSPLLRWFDYRLRFIEPRRRRVRWSNKFPSAIPDELATEFSALVRAMTDGEDLNCFQGTGLVNTDTSGKRRRNRTDLLWAEWGIHHLHIQSRSVTPGKYFSARSDFLLFAIFYRDDVLFIDIRPHSGDDYLFERDSLMTTVAENWPEVIEPYKSRTVLAPTTLWTDADRKKLRAAGINTPLVIDGQVCFPLGGITSAATSTLVFDAQRRLYKDLESVSASVLDSGREFLRVLPEGAVPEQSFSLALSPRGTTLICDVANIGWPFPDAKHDGTDGPFERLSDALTPPWIRAALAANLEGAQSQ